jgi:hypothetical protein
MKKKLLIISLNKPFPFSHGGAVAQYFYMENLLEKYDVSYCTVLYTEKEKKSLKILQLELDGLKLECLDKISVKKKYSYLRKLLTKTNKILRYFILNEKNKLEKNIDYINTNNFLSYPDKDFILFLEKLLKINSYDFVQCEFFDTINLAPIIPKGVKKIFIHHEIKFKTLQLTKLNDKYYKDFKVELTRNLEICLLNMFDIIVVFNDNDFSLLKNSLPNNKLYLSPFGIPSKLIVKKDVSKVFNKFLFIGGELLYPNKEGLIWFLNDIYIPNYEIISWPVYIIGNWSDEFKETFLEYKKIIFTGFVDSLSKYYDNSVMISPITSGSGIRTKILQAFANKIPVMSTKFASEGLFDELKSVDHIIHFDSEIDFLFQFNKIISETDLLTKIGYLGFEYYNLNFNVSKLLEKRIAIYES